MVRRSKRIRGTMVLLPVLLISAFAASAQDLGNAEAPDDRLAAIEDARLLAIGKLDMIREGASAQRPSPFLYVAPTPREVLARMRKTITLLAPTGSGTSERSAPALAVVNDALVAADSVVVDAYQRVLRSGVSDMAAGKAREYLSAYVIGTRQDGGYKSMLMLIGREVTGGALPVFLADDALSLGDMGAFVEIMGELDSVDWAEWPEGEEARLYTAMAAASERHADTHWALTAHEKIVLKGNPAQAEQAQTAIIAFYAEKAKDYTNAARACEDYIIRFPAGRDVIHNEYLKALYEWQAREFDSALAGVQAFRDRHPDSELIPSVILLQGLVYTGQGNCEGAVGSYDELITRYPEHELAPKAHFLTGYTYLVNAQYVEAQATLQRAVDFFPGDSYATQARVYLKELKNAFPSSR